eukprot:COSAG02_NODE_14561_length_1259_cov_6.828448_2_plen_209_part_00
MQLDKVESSEWWLEPPICLQLAMVGTMARGRAARNAPRRTNPQTSPRPRCAAGARFRPRYPCRAPIFGAACAISPGNPSLRHRSHPSSPSTSTAPDGRPATSHTASLRPYELTTALGQHPDGHIQTAKNARECHCLPGKSDLSARRNNVPSPRSGDTAAFRATSSPLIEQVKEYSNTMPINRSATIERLGGRILARSGHCQHGLISRR